MRLVDQEAPSPPPGPSQPQPPPHAQPHSRSHSPPQEPQRDIHREGPSAALHRLSPFSVKSNPSPPDSPRAAEAASFLQTAPPGGAASCQHSVHLPQAPTPSLSHVVRTLQHTRIDDRLPAHSTALESSTAAAAEDTKRNEWPYSQHAQHGRAPPFPRSEYMLVAEVRQAAVTFAAPRGTRSAEPPGYSEIEAAVSHQAHSGRMHVSFPSAAGSLMPSSAGLADILPWRLGARPSDTSAVAAEVWSADRAESGSMFGVSRANGTAQPVSCAAARSMDSHSCARPRSSQISPRVSEDPPSESANSHAAGAAGASTARAPGKSSFMAGDVSVSGGGANDGRTRSIPSSTLATDGSTAPICRAAPLWPPSGESNAAETPGDYPLTAAPLPRSIQGSLRSGRHCSRRGMSGSQSRRDRARHSRSPGGPDRPAVRSGLGPAAVHVTCARDLRPPAACREMQGPLSCPPSTSSCRSYPQHLGLPVSAAAAEGKRAAAAALSHAAVAMALQSCPAKATLQGSAVAAAPHGHDTSADAAGVALPRVAAGYTHNQHVRARAAAAERVRPSRPSGDGDGDRAELRSRMREPPSSSPARSPIACEVAQVTLASAYRDMMGQPLLPPPPIIPAGFSRDPSPRKIAEAPPRAAAPPSQRPTSELSHSHCWVDDLPSLAPHQPRPACAAVAGPPSAAHGGTGGVLSSCASSHGFAPLPDRQPPPPGAHIREHKQYVVYQLDTLEVQGRDILNGLILQQGCQTRIIGGTTSHCTCDHVCTHAPPKPLIVPHAAAVAVTQVLALNALLFRRLPGESWHLL